jgi:hypothetical protein
MFRNSRGRSPRNSRRREMAQFRFQIGVQGAGSAARDAESAREHRRSLRPEAGSAARQAEEERRAAEASEPPQRSRVISLRVQGAGGRTGQALPMRGADAQEAISAEKSEETSRSSRARAPYPVDAAPASGPAGADTLSHDANPRSSAQLTPLQTAAAQVRSLFRSVFPRAKGEN